MICFLGATINLKLLIVRPNYHNYYCYQFIVDFTIDSSIANCGTNYHNTSIVWCKLHPNVVWQFNKQYFPVVLCIMLYKVVLSFESVDEILKCDDSNESYWAVLSCLSGHIWRIQPQNKKREPRAHDSKVGSGNERP